MVSEPRCSTGWLPPENRRTEPKSSDILSKVDHRSHAVLIMMLLVSLFYERRCPSSELVQFFYRRILLNGVGAMT